MTEKRMKRYFVEVDIERMDGSVKRASSRPLMAAQAEELEKSLRDLGLKPEKREESLTKEEIEEETRRAEAGLERVRRD